MTPAPNHIPVISQSAKEVVSPALENIASGNCLITGGAGNLACQLAWELAPRFEMLILVDVAPQPILAVPANVSYESCDIRDFVGLEKLFQTYRPSAIIHLASLLSGSSERDPRLAWHINTTATLEILEQSKKIPDVRIIFASSVATYGGSLPDLLMEDQPQWPTTLYGVTKIACERLGAYARTAHGIDFRCVRLPIILSRYSPAGAVSAVASRCFIESTQTGRYIFRARPETMIAGLYVKDALKGFVNLLAAPREKITQAVYNIGGFTTSFGDISKAIRHHLPQVEHRFELDAGVDDILSRWPREIDDHAARADWGWKPDFDLTATASDFLQDIHAATKPTS